MTIDYASKGEKMDYRIDLAVLEEQENYARFGLTLHNLSDHDLHDWALNVSFRRYIQPASLTQGSITQTGSFCRFVPNQHHTLAANAHFMWNLVAIPPHFNCSMMVLMMQLSKPIFQINRNLWR